MERIARSIDGVELVQDSIAPLRAPTAPQNNAAEPSLPITLTIRDDRAWSVVARHGSAGLGEGYFRGWWDTDDLVGILRLFVRRSAGLDALRSKVHRYTGPVTDRLRSLRQANPLRDRHNVRAHYDLSNEFFASFLDETMTYSSAVFDTPETPLADASIAKLDRLCKKLHLEPEQRLVEIGTGWGSFAMHAAERYDVEVTTTTISAAQADLARKRFAEAGLTERITLAEMDFRSLSGTFQRLVSIEMIEAVDWRDLEEYFSSCAGLLDDDGLMGLQAIVCADQRHDRVKVTDDFITTWVFPGGCLPSITSIANAATKASDLRIIDLEDLGPHYAETLGRWRETLHARWGDLPDLGLSDEMARLWDFYLAYCQAAFLERHVSVVQVVLAKSGWRPEHLALRTI
jgi:cyclopropane-fatty-acyl-phospholipid synthase